MQEPIVVRYDKELEHDLKHNGRPRHFDVDKWYQAIEMLIMSDEIKLALKMFDMLPGYFRDNYPTKLRDMKQNILSRIVTVEDYAHHYDTEMFENATTWERETCGVEHLGQLIDKGFACPRGPIVVSIVKQYNEAGIKPIIIEMGPATFWLPYGLKDKGLDFHYYASTINKKALADHRPHLEDVWLDDYKGKPHQIFCCFEVMEHLWDEQDILHNYCRLGVEADSILLSTPKHTLLGGHDMPWQERRIEHLATYTPTEFSNIAHRLFKGYNFLWYDGFMQVLHGQKQQ